MVALGELVEFEANQHNINHVRRGDRIDHRVGKGCVRRETDQPTELDSLVRRSADDSLRDLPIGNLTTRGRFDDLQGEVVRHEVRISVQGATPGNLMQLEERTGIGGQRECASGTDGVTEGHLRRIEERQHLTRLEVIQIHWIMKVLLTIN